MAARTAEPAARQRAIDRDNRAFWDEACGTGLARELSLRDNDPESLRRYDAAYFAIYPYLARHIPFADLNGQRVLEVGLGHGNVAQRLAEAGAVYTGIDIAAGPVAMVRHRFGQAAAPGRALQASILAAPFAEGSFDAVISIGVLHHTGDAAAALAEVHRLLKPGGRAVVMVYNAYSYRRWLRFPGPTVRYWLWDFLGMGARPEAGAAERLAYDHDSQGDDAPATAFLSRRELRRIGARFRTVRASLEQSGGLRTLGLRGRLILCATLGRAWGLDIYVTLIK